MANVRKFQNRSTLPRNFPRTSEQAFETIEKADLAMQKLYFDEQLTEDELQALLASGVGLAPFARTHLSFLGWTDLVV